MSDDTSPGALTVRSDFMAPYSAFENGVYQHIVGPRQDCERYSIHNNQVENKAIYELIVRVVSYSMS